MNNIAYALHEYCQPTNVVRPTAHLYDSDDIRFGDILHHQMIDSSTPNVVLLGVPQHIGVERNGGRIGAADAPDAIRSWLYKLTANSGTHRIAQHYSLLDAGNIRTEGLTLEQIHEAQYHVVRSCLEAGVRVIVLGGGHDIAFSNGLALGSVSSTIGIINFDAHLDVRPLRNGLRHSGTPFRQLLESIEVQIPAGCFVEFGIQPFTAAAHHIEYVQNLSHHVMMLDDIYHIGYETALRQLWNHAAQAESVYCSFDMDCIASAFAPGVSAPATTGFSAQEILHAARILASQPQNRLFDIVELNPHYDIDGRTAKLAATIVAYVLAGFNNK